MLRLGLLLSCLYLGLFLSCKTQNNALNGQTETSKMELILQDDHSGAITEELLVIKNQKSLNAFFAKINKTRKPGLAVPDIDFNVNMLLVWCAGETTVASPGLVVQKETLESYTIAKLTPKNQAKNTAVISPFLVYKLPLSDKNITIK